MDFTYVEGTDKGEVTLYALSTCGWCRKTRDLLGELGAKYRYLYVDLLSGAERTEAIELVREHNPALSFPTMVVNGAVILGFDEKRIREALQ